MTEEKKTGAKASSNKSKKTSAKKPVAKKAAAKGSSTRKSKTAKSDVKAKAKPKTSLIQAQIPRVKQVYGEEVVLSLIHI